MPTLSDLQNDRSSLQSRPPPYPIVRFSIEQYNAIVDAGILNEDENCELLEGWIIPKSLKTPRHDGTIDIILGHLSKVLPDNWFLRVQNGLQTATSVPEPAFAVARGKPGRFADRHPQGTDVGLVIEVADSSLEIDRRKATVYAAAGVPVYWIINLRELCVEVFTDPRQCDNGMSYAESRVFGKHDELELVLDGKVVFTLKCELLVSA